MSKERVKHNKIRCSKGFTLVELSLSMVFIAILSIIIVVVINGTVSSYRRGITLNLLNTVGSELVEDITMAVQESPVDSGLCSGTVNNSDGCKRVSWVKSKKVGDEDVPLFGAFCTGNYSYVWNSGYYFDEGYKDTWESGLRATLQSSSDGSSRITISPGSESPNSRLFKLVKIKDAERTACQIDTEGDVEISIDRKMDKEQYILDEDNSGVAVYNLKVNSLVDGGNGGGQLYSMTLTLGTAQSGMNIDATGGKCAVPAESNSNLDYCAINKFSFAALANGNGNGGKQE